MWSLRLAIAAALLAYLFRAVPAAQVFEIFQRAQVWGVVAAFVISLLIQLIAASRMKILADAHGLGLRVFEIFEINLVSRFYGLFLPGGSFTAIGIRVFKLVQIHRHYAGAIAAVTLDRAMTTVTMCLVGIACFTSMPAPGQLPWLFAMLAVLAALALPCIWLYCRPVAVSPPSPAKGWLRSWLPSIGLAISEARSMPARHVAQVIGWGVLVQLLGIAQYFALAQSLELDVSILALGWIRTAMLTATLIPLSISGLGMREGAALLTLPAYGVSLETALAYSLLVFAVTNLAVGLTGGVFELVRMVLVRARQVP